MTPKKTNTTNIKHNHPITHIHNVTSHPKTTKLTLRTKPCEKTIQQNPHQEKDKMNLCKIKWARPNGLAQKQSKSKHSKTTNMPNNNSNKKTYKQAKNKHNIPNNNKHTKKHITHIISTHKDNSNEQKTTSKHLTKPNTSPPYTTRQTKNQKYINKYTRPNNFIHNQTTYKKKPKNHINTHNIKPYIKHAQHKQTKTHPKTYLIHPLLITCKHIDNKNNTTTIKTRKPLKTPTINQKKSKTQNTLTNNIFNKPHNKLPLKNQKKPRPIDLAQEKPTKENTHPKTKKAKHNKYNIKTHTQLRKNMNKSKFGNPEKLETQPRPLKNLNGPNLKTNKYQQTHTKNTNHNIKIEPNNNKTKHKVKTKHFKNKIPPLHLLTLCFANNEKQSLQIPSWKSNTFLQKKPKTKKITKYKTSSKIIMHLTKKKTNITNKHPQKPKNSHKKHKAYKTQTIKRTQKNTPHTALSITSQTITPHIPRNPPQNHSKKPQHITPRNHLKQARPNGLAQIPKHKIRQGNQYKTIYTKQTQNITIKHTNHITIKHINHITHLDHQLNINNKKIWYTTYKEHPNPPNIHILSPHFLIILREDIQTNRTPMSKPLPTNPTKITQHTNLKNHLKRTRPTGLVQKQKKQSKTNKLTQNYTYQTNTKKNPSNTQNT
jgi:hypothetical protein